MDGKEIHKKHFRNAEARMLSAYPEGIHDTKDIFAQYYFTSLGLEGEEYQQELLASVVIFSHMIDDVVDIQENLPYEDRTALANIFEDLMDIEEEDIYTNAAFDVVVSRLSSAYQNLSGRTLNTDARALHRDIPLFLYYARKTGGKENEMAFKKSFLQLILAGLVQTTEDSSKRGTFTTSYRRVINKIYTGGEAFMNDLPLNVLIARASGLQLMFSSILEKIDSPLYSKIVADFDSLLAPLVYLMNSDKEETVAPEMSVPKDELLEGFALDANEAFKRITENKNWSNDPKVKTLYNRKIKQLAAGLAYILLKNENHPFNTDSRCRSLKYLYFKLLPAPLLRAYL